MLHRRAQQISNDFWLVVAPHEQGLGYTDKDVVNLVFF